MTKLGKEIAENIPEPEMGQAYKIIKAASKETASNDEPNKKMTGIEVTFQRLNAKHEPVPDSAAQTMLWVTDKKAISSTSKLGAFLSVLGDETDNWIGRNILIVEWRSKHRSIRAL